VSDALEIKRELQLRILDVCHDLLPGGKKRGHEYRAGSLGGGAGASLAVHLAGSKAGTWAEFNGEAGGERGDVFDLIRAVRRCSFVEALDWARSFCGITPVPLTAPARREYRRPERPANVHVPREGSRVFDYLTGARRLPESTLRAYQVAEGEFPGEGAGAAMVFASKRAGELVMVKWIALDREDGKKRVTTSKGAEPVLFGWQAVPDDARALVIAEGEIDAMTWHAMTGLPAVAPPRGTGDEGWVAAEFARLERFETIYLAYDGDEPGRKAVERIAPRFGERARIVGHLGTGKDANEWLQAGATAEDFRRLLAESRDLRPGELRSPLEYLEAVLEEFHPTSKTAFGPEPPFGKIAGRVHFRPSEVSVWTGFNHHGKSEMLNYLMVSAMFQDARACIASLEVPVKKTLRRMVRQATGEEVPSDPRIREAHEWLTGRVWFYDSVETIKLARLLEVMRYARRRYDCSQFVVDNLARLGVAEDDYTGQKDVMCALVDFVNQTGAHVHLVAHPRKGADESSPPGKQDVRGGGVLTDLAHNVFTVWRNVPKQERLAKLEAKGDPEGEIRAAVEEDCDAVFAVRKQRETGDTPMMRLWWHRGSLQYHEQPWQRPFCFIDTPAPLRDRAERAADEPEFAQWEDEGPLPF
jgi:twinkle protein